MNIEFDFSYKTVVITGASAGIGFQTALEFCRRGAFVIGVGRSADHCSSAREKILRSVPDAKIEYLLADLSKQQEVRRLAKEIKQLLAHEQINHLDVLVNNAGTFVDRLTLTEDGIEKTVAVNHLAPFLLTYLLLPLLEKSNDSRILTVSSDSHFRTFLIPERIRKPALHISLWQYKVSKLANVLFTLEFNLLHKGRSPHAFAVDPGLVNTDIGLKGTGVLSSYIWKQRQKAGVDPIRPATTLLFLAGDRQSAQSNAVYWYDCAEKQPSRNALDQNLARRLWVESEKLCHIRYDMQEN